MHSRSLIRTFGICSLIRAFGGGGGGVGEPKYTDNPLYTDTRYDEKIRYNDNLTVTKPSLKR